MQKKIREEIESIEIPHNVIPLGKDYKRGFCLYKIEGHIQPRYVPYDENLDSFKEDSQIYKYGTSILRKYNLNPNDYTLQFRNNYDWACGFKLIKL